MFDSRQFRGFKDRRDAGRRLAARLETYRRKHPIVLGLPRGGVAVAAEIAKALGAPLDVLVSRKVGAPGQPELAIGAVAPGGVQLFEPYYVRAMKLTQEDLDRLAARERQEMERRIVAFRGHDDLPDVAGKTAIVVDDGIATGATALAGIRALRTADPARVVLAAAVSPPDIADRLRDEADELVVLEEPEPFIAVGAWFRNFREVTDDEVRQLLEEARHRTSAAEAP